MWVRRKGSSQKIKEKEKTNTVLVCIANGKMLFLFASVSAWLLQAADADEDEARYRLSPEMVARYRRDGFVVLKGVFNGDGLNAVRPGKLTAKDREALSGDHALQKAVVLGNPETDEDPNTVIKLEGAL